MVALSWSGDAAAQNGQQAQQRAITADANQDQIITRQEWIDFQSQRIMPNVPDEVRPMIVQGIAQTADAIDTNRDGILQQQEFIAFQNANR